MNCNPRISVVCPTYNSEHFISNTLKTVLNQTKLPFELIVSDDGSTDNTVAKVDAFFRTFSGLDTHLIKNPHQGAGATRNAAILRAKGEWIAFLDSDDLWKPNKIAVVSEAIRKHPEANFIFHNEDRIKLDGTKTLLHDFSSFYREELPLTYQLWRYCIFHTSAVTCQKELLLDCGLFNEALMSSQDWELWIRMSPHIRFHHIRKVLGTYIDRSDNITSTKSFKGLLNRLKIMSIHWGKSGATVSDYVYMVLRRLVGFVLREFNIMK